MSAVPLAALVLLEIVLRLAGYGHPTGFFVPSRIEGRNVLIQNDAFGLRFFPPSMVRRPLPLTLERRKAPGSLRIFVFGESAAMGDPDPAFGFSRMLAEMLRQRFPGTEFEVINTAFTAINSHAILPIADACAGLDGDLWVVYMGNNEMEGPFGAGEAFGTRALPRFWIRTTLALTATRTGQWLQAIRRRLAPAPTDAAGWEGLSRVAEHRIAPDDPARDRVRSHFKNNLQDLLGIAARARVPVLLGTVACNLREAAPFATLPTAGSPARPRVVSDAMARAAELEATGQFEKAADAYAAAAAEAKGDAEFHFRHARCLAQAGRPGAADAFALARDLDALPLRCDSLQNQAIREAALGRDHVVLVDLERTLGAAAPAGVPGHESFLEHVHLTFDGNYQLARAFAEAARTRLPDAVRRADRGAWPEPVDVARSLGWTAWSEFAVWESMLRRIATAPFTNQLTHPATVSVFTNRLAALRERMRPEDLAAALEDIRAALADRPGDPLLAANLARLLESAGQNDEAAAAWEQVRIRLPQAPVPHFELGRLALRRRRPEDAIEPLRRAMALRPEVPEIRLELARALRDANRSEEASPLLARLVNEQPGSVEAALLLAATQERAGHTNDALQTLLGIVQRRSDSVPARLEAARVSLANRRITEAAELYRQASALAPTNSAARLGLADALARAGRRAEATAALRQAVDALPQSWQAHYLLGVELASQGNLKEAESAFTQVILLKPDFALAHFNLGVALAQQERFGEALSRFRESLRLDPRNAETQRYLQLVERALQTSSGR